MNAAPLTPGMLRAYLRQHERVSLRALAAHFSTSIGMVESVLAYWRQRDKIETGGSIVESATTMNAATSENTQPAPSALPVCGKSGCSSCPACSPSYLPPQNGVAVSPEASSLFVRWKEQ